MFLVILMIVYVDLVILLNFAFDFLLLMVVKITLKRNIKLIRVILGSLVGALSILFLFIKINSLTLFLFKIGISILMLLIAFGYKNRKYFISNFLYLYMTSIVLGGFLYFLNTTFSYKSEGLVFFHKGLGINAIFLIIFSPIILYIYIRQARSLKNNFSEYYETRIIFLNGRSIKLAGMVDTGNKLLCPYSNKPIILIEKKKLKGVASIRDPILVPYQALNTKSILRCIKVKEIVIDNKRANNLLVGLSENSFNMNGVDCILNTKIMEDLK